MTSSFATIPQTCQRLPPGLRAAAFCTGCSRPSGSGDSVRSIARLLAFLVDAAANLAGISPTRASEDCSSISRAIAAFGHDLAAGAVAQPKRSSRFKSVSTLSINERGCCLDRFTGMTTFVKVVDAGSFAAAAHHFGMSRGDGEQARSDAGRTPWCAITQSHDAPCERDRSWTTLL